MMTLKPERPPELQVPCPDGNHEPLIPQSLLLEPRYPVHHFNLCKKCFCFITQLVNPPSWSLIRCSTCEQLGNDPHLTSCKKQGVVQPHDDTRIPNPYQESQPKTKVQVQK